MAFPFDATFVPHILAVLMARSRGRRYRALRPWWTDASTWSGR